MKVDINVDGSTFGPAEVGEGGKPVLITSDEQLRYLLGGRSKAGDVLWDICSDVLNTVDEDQRGFVLEIMDSIITAFDGE